MNNNDVPFEIMQKTRNNTWKQIREDINKKLLIEENYNILVENENLMVQNANLMSEIERLQNEIEKHKFEKTVILTVVFILLIIMTFLRA